MPGSGAPSDLAPRLVAAGRILNRFTKDTASIDSELTFALAVFFMSAGSLLAAVTALGIATSGTLLLVLLPVAYLYYKIQQYFRKSTIEIQRMESLSRSPVFASFSETLSGLRCACGAAGPTVHPREPGGSALQNLCVVLTPSAALDSTIRAFRQQDRFVTRISALMDTNNAVLWIQSLMMSWITLRLQMIGSVITFAVVAIATAFPDLTTVRARGCEPSRSDSPNASRCRLRASRQASLAAVAITESLNITHIMREIVNAFAFAESKMNAVERVAHYSHSLEQEPKQELKPAEPWPAEVRVEPSRDVDGRSGVATAPRRIDSLASRCD